jgi:hypothetical protein
MTEEERKMAEEKNRKIAEAFALGGRTDGVSDFLAYQCRQILKGYIGWNLVEGMNEDDIFTYHVEGKPLVDITVHREAFEEFTIMKTGHRVISAEEKKDDVSEV